jgi:hypothetical protein
MRTWTLAFLAVATILVLAGSEDFGALLSMGARIVFTLVVALALVAGLLRLARQRLPEVDLPPSRLRARSRRAGRGTPGTSAARAVRPNAPPPIAPARCAGDGRTR